MISDQRLRSFVVIFMPLFMACPVSFEKNELQWVEGLVSMAMLVKGGSEYHREA